ncbi:O-methyltransferase [Tunturiibacter gelidiferens]|uniref:O-methyltransferase n=1 Tax=Tunturiibacter gelidiferens TaxID=3069689 RepID=UPI003D9B51A0
MNTQIAARSATTAAIVVCTPLDFGHLAMTIHRLRPLGEAQAQVSNCTTTGLRTQLAPPATRHYPHLHMNQDLWTSVDRFLTDTLIHPDQALDEAMRANRDAGLPAIDVAPNQGKLLHLVARIHKAKRILEVGTLGGYSTIWLARALPPDGKLVTLELNPTHAQVAAANINRAGLSSLVDIRVGPALESLASLHEEHAFPFDLIFLDADKPNNPVYLEWAIKLSRPGTVIIGDNVIRDGAILDPNSTDPVVSGTRTFVERLGTHPRLDATALQTVGSRGYDGFAIAIVNE